MHRPGGPDARSDGNVIVAREGVQQIKWTTEDFDTAGDGRLPAGKPSVEWSYGDVEHGFEQATLVLDETFVTAGVSHHSMEPRTAMSYWQQNGVSCREPRNHQLQLPLLNGECHIRVSRLNLRNGLI